MPSISVICCIAVCVVAIMLCVFLAFGCYALYRLADYLVEKELLCSHIRDVFRDVKCDFRAAFGKRMTALINSLSFSKQEDSK